jgi:pyruvate-ferredoxin/flavodoxin oxidoreductase
MTGRRTMTVDGNEAAASVAHRVSEVIAIYPITPSSRWASSPTNGRIRAGEPLGQHPGRRRDAVGGGCRGSGARRAAGRRLSTTFTASQGLLLMIPNMFKIAGELTPFTMHVAARTIATHALSIFGDHSDVMACRTTGFAMLSARACRRRTTSRPSRTRRRSTRASRSCTFFDGFRTSHEVSKIEELTDDDLRALLSEEQVAAHRRRGLTPDHPVLRGTAQNPDTFFQAREAANLFYRACPDIVEQLMARFAALTGRRLRPVRVRGRSRSRARRRHHGVGRRDRARDGRLSHGRGDKVGVLKVHLFAVLDRAFLRALPRSVKAIAVMDRTKEPGALGEPLYQDVVTALAEARADGTTSFAAEPVVVGGRYGPVLQGVHARHGQGNLRRARPSRRPKNHFTVGIMDDVTHTSLALRRHLRYRAGRRHDRGVLRPRRRRHGGANKNSIKIIGEETDLHVQGYFVYDSKKLARRRSPTCARVLVRSGRPI